MLRHGLARAESYQLDAYLETSIEANVSFDGAHGFRLTETWTFGESDPQA